MHVQPTRPTTILARLREIVAEALQLDAARVLLSPDPAMLGRLPPAAERFAALVPRSVRFEAGPQHPGVWPALLELDTCIYSRVAVDRPIDTTALLTDTERGLLPLADALLAALAGHELPPPKKAKDVQLLRGPLMCTAVQPIRWGESGNLILAYISLSWIAPFEFAIP